MADRKYKNGSVQGGTNGNNTKAKKAQGKELLVTKESFCATFALMSALAFVILISGTAIFGEPGGYIQSLLLGVFGYAAYPITALACYACVMGFIGKRIFKNRRAVLLLNAVAVLGALVAHSVQTLFVGEWTMDGYLTACFEAGAAFPSVTVFGWVGGVVVFALSSVITPVGGLVVLSAVTLLTVYLFGKMALANVSLPAHSVKGENAVAQVAQQAGYQQPNANRPEWKHPDGTPVLQPMNGFAQQPVSQSQSQGQAYSQSYQQPYAQPTPEQQRVETPSQASPRMPYTVRQRPGFFIQEDEYMQSGQKPTQPNSQMAPQPSFGGVEEDQSPQLTGYSPFGLTEGLSFPSNGLTPEQSRQILFGATPKQNYQDNLIFDTNSSANKRSIGNYPMPSMPTPNASSMPNASTVQSMPNAQNAFSQGTPVTPSAQPAPTYSQQYQQSLQQSEPIHPKKIVGDSAESFGGRPVSNPYGLDIPQTPARGAFDSSARLSSRDVDNLSRDSRASFLNEPAQPQSRNTFLNEPAQNELSDRSSFRRGMDMEEQSNTFADRATPVPEGRYTEPVVPTEPEIIQQSRYTEPAIPAVPATPVESTEPTVTAREEGGRRHEYMNLFTMDNPNVFGASGNRLGNRNAEETERVDHSSLFEDDANTDTRSTRDDPYRLQTFDDEPSFEDTFTSRRVEQTRSERASFEPTRSERFIEEPAAPMQPAEPVTPTQPTPVVDQRVELQSQSAPMGTPMQATPVEPNVQKVEIEVKAQPAPAPQPEPKVEPKPEPPKPKYHKPYVRVPLHYFNCSDNPPDSDVGEVEDVKRRIVETLEDYNVAGGTIASVTFGPTVTRYNVILPRGVSPKKVVNLEQEIAMGLCREGVNVYLNVEDGAVSIEVPNRNRQTVELGSMFIDDAYTKAKPTSLVFAMGKDIANRKVYGDVCKMTHLLVAGSSGSGKSVFLGCLIISLITKYSPDDMRLILIDPKKTEFVLYNNLPHLMVNEIITDCKKAVQSLSWAIGEMERRYTLIAQKSASGTYVVNIDEYNANLAPGEEKLPKIVIIVDELADLMLNAKKDMEDKIQSLTQKARAAGIHLILATQRPSTDVITGVIKSNLPTRIAFTVATDVDSRVILDQTGAQKLLGKGDMVYTASGINTPVRVQSPFISSSDSQKVVNFIKENNEAYFDESATTFINNTRAGGSGGEDGEGSGEIDPVYLECLKLVIQVQNASISLLQRKCSIGFNKAGKIIEWMEEMGFVSPYEGTKRRVLITQQEYVERFGEW